MNNAISNAVRPPTRRVRKTGRSMRWSSGRPRDFVISPGGMLVRANDPRAETAMLRTLQGSTQGRKREWPLEGVSIICFVTERDLNPDQPFERAEIADHILGANTRAQTHLIRLLNAAPRAHRS